MDKIQVEVIAATTIEPKYLSCVEFFIEFWLSVGRKNSPNQFVPKVLIIQEFSSEKPIKFKKKYEQYVKYHLTELPTTFVSQNIRALACSTSEYDFSITSDIDMFPLSTRVFDHIISELRFKSDSIAIARDVLSDEQFPICYTIASPKIWKQVFGNKIDFNNLNSELDKIFKKYIGKCEYTGHHGGDFWYVDQMHLFRQIYKFDSSFEKVLRFQDDVTKHNRLDREDHRFPVNWFNLPKLALGNFTDYHVHHPVSKNIKYIRVVLSIQKFKHFISHFLKKS